jgi:hypothetical protein
MDVADWIRALGLEQYGTTFRENDVNAELLPKITAESLRELSTRYVGDGILTYFGWPPPTKTTPCGQRWRSFIPSRRSRNIVGTWWGMLLSGVATCSTA